VFKERWYNDCEDVHRVCFEIITLNYNINKSKFKKPGCLWRDLRRETLPIISFAIATSCHKYHISRWKYLSLDITHLSFVKFSDSRGINNTTRGVNEITVRYKWYPYNVEPWPVTNYITYLNIYKAWSPSKKLMHDFEDTLCYVFVKLLTVVYIITKNVSNSPLT
jgi:hypothetical protein